VSKIFEEQLLWLKMKKTGWSGVLLLLLLPPVI